MKPSDLAESARAQVAAGLPVGTLDQANAQLRRLAAESLLPLCPLARAQSPPASAQPSAPTISQTPAPGAETSAPQEGSVSPPPTSATPSVTALSPPPPQPGTGCRTPE
jgi:PPM family protein phosphatase